VVIEELRGCPERAESRFSEVLERLRGAKEHLHLGRLVGAVVLTRDRREGREGGEVNAAFEELRWLVVEARDVSVRSDGASSPHATTTLDLAARSPSPLSLLSILNDPSCTNSNRPKRPGRTGREGPCPETKGGGSVEGIGSAAAATQQPSSTRTEGDEQGGEAWVAVKSR